MKYKLIVFIFIITISKSNSQNNIIDCSNCDKNKLTVNQLKHKTAEELRLLLNEIYARNGYVFKTQQFSRHFENQEWYKPLDENRDVNFSYIEKQNISLLKNLEKKEKQRRIKALNDLRKLKNELNNSNIKAVREYVPEKKLNEQWAVKYESVIKELKFLLDKIDLDDINWNKEFGYYNHSIDNGYSITSYKLVFSKSEIKIGGGMYSHSKNFGDFDDGYSDYMSEAESQSFWIFKVTENGIEFDHLEIFG